MNEKNNIQAKVARTLLEDRKTVVLGGKEYAVAPPTLGTLVRASEMIARMPERIDPRKGREFHDILAAAKDHKALASLVAVLILGAKKAKETTFVGGKRRLFIRKEKVPVTKEEALSREILDNVSPAEIKNVIVSLLEGLELDDFFITTTFLTGINVTKPTKVVTEATASGASSGGSQNTTT